MIDQVTNTKWKFKRFIGSTEFYELWFFFLFFIFIVIGSYPLIKVIYQKHMLSKELRIINSSLQKKLSNLQEREPAILEAKKFQPYIDKYVPLELDIQDYMIDFVFAVSRAGYSVVRFVPMDRAATGAPEKGVIVTVGLEGAGDPSKIISNIEELKRITKIENLDYSLGKDRTLVNLKLLIYSEEEL